MVTDGVTSPIIEMPPEWNPPAALRSYLAVLTHIRMGEVRTSRNEGMRYTDVTGEAELRIALSLKGLDEPLWVIISEVPSRWPTPWRMESAGRMLLSMRDTLSFAKNPHKEWPAEVSAVWEAIVGRCCEPISLEILADEQGKSPSYLGWQVMKFLGSSFRQLLAEERVTRAAHRLVTTDHNVNDIARWVSWSPSQFPRVFRVLTGMSPREYRKNLSPPKRILRG